MAISVGSVEVDVIPSTQGIRQRLQNGLLPAANSVGDEMGRVMARYLATHIAQGVRDGVTQGGRTAQAPAARQGSQTGSAFARGFKTRLEAGLRDLPEVRLNANSTDAEREIARIRAQMTALKDVRIGIDISEADAQAAMARLQARLTRLSESSANVSVRVDAGAAAAQLAAFQAEVNRLDGRSADVDVDTHAGVAGMQALVTAALAFGPAIIPVLPVVAAGLGAIAAAGVAAGAGIGGIALVAAPAFKGIASALQAQKAAQDATTSSTAGGAAAGASAARQAMQQASAQQALATAQRNAARQIADAEKAVGTAVRQAAQNNAQAAAQVKSARQSLADAYAQAADRMESANKQVQQAEKDLAAAQKSARQAQLDLTAARKEAEQQLEDLNNRLVDSRLSQRDAEIALKEATAERNKVLASGASELEKKKAVLQYDQAVQRLKEQTLETKRLKVETTAANKAGVDGSDTVRSAQERLASAQQDVVDRTTAVRDAQQNVTKTQIANSRAIADAQDKLASAQRNVAETQRQGAEAIAAAQERVVQAQQSGADSIASAQRQIASASLSAAGGVDQAALAQAKYRAELAKLTPSARGTFNAFIQLRSAFGAWSKSLQPDVMPIFTRGLNGIRRTLPTLTPFVKDAAAAIKGLQDRVSASLKRPFWQGFKKDLQGSVKPAIEGLGVSFGQTVKGMAGVVDAFLPHMDGISKKMQSLTGRFANWGTNLKGSPQFEEFLSFSADKAPLIGKALQDIARAFLKIGEALAPVSGPILKVISILADGIATVAEHAPWLVVAIWGIIVAVRIWTIAQWALNAASKANPWTLVIIGIIALVAAIIYAYNKFGWFRTAVQATWNALKTGALWVWNTVLKPFFAWFGQIVTWLWTSIIKPYIGFIIGYWKTVASVVMWVWRTVLSPVFGFLSLAARILATVYVTVLVVAFKIWWTAAKTYFNAVAAIAKWLWNSVLSPVIGFIVGGFKLWWSGAKLYFGLVKAGFRAVGASARWLWEKAISPVVRLIVGGAKWMWSGVKVVFGYFRDGIKTLAGWAKWLHTKAVKPAWDGIVSAGRSAYDRGIRPVFDGWKRITRGMGDVFKTAVVAIKKQWDKVKNIAKIPVSFVVNRVYNDGLVGVWNKVAGAFGAPKLKKYHFASGGIMPGYTPGRDVHRFVSPTGGQLDLSGGEAIMRPEFTRAVGSGFVGTLNSLARSRGAQGVKAALAPVLGGNPRTPTDRSLPYSRGGVLPVQRYADGGIFGWIKKTASSAVGAGSDAWNAIKKTASWLKDSLAASARAGVRRVVDPLLNSFPGMDTGFGKMIRRIPNKMIDTLFGYAKKSDDKGAGGIGGPRIDAALRWAKTQAGKPYQWAGNGNPSWDCSGLMSAIESVIRGQKPHRRWATMAFSGRTAPPGWVYHGNSAFKVGITNAGVGHTAGTLGKTNVESRGGDGVIVGPRARGYKAPLFNSWYGFQPGKYDSGGYLQPGLNLAYNGTGRPEPVFTTQQANALTGRAFAGGDGLGDLSVNVWVGDQQITDIARTEVRRSNGELLTALSARPTRR
ncbi:chemotaxis protein histidine kinase CheA [Streptomyces sp. B3I7]|uniref:hypothetical protein n=1 Tax=Streptomyces sp. B3I7 TaxID=3042269 RepID=UPI00278309CE|nr:hypothetical protein [Streptomyces sp. B3I7]MDQ0809807.1 chemotaxis protein histidine kinase CheA [Streptomyces sp. B3I7]